MENTAVEIPATFATQGEHLRADTDTRKLQDVACALSRRTAAANLHSPTTKPGPQRAHVVRSPGPLPAGNASQNSWQLVTTSASVAPPLPLPLLPAAAAAAAGGWLGVHV